MECSYIVELLEENLWPILFKEIKNIPNIDLIIIGPTIYEESLAGANKVEFPPCFHYIISINQ